MDTSEQPRVDALLRKARTRIDAGEAEILLAHVLGRPRSWLFAHATDAVTQAEAGALEALLRRREQGQPVAYLTRRRGFWTLELAVSDAVLVPRAETERLVELALERIPPGDAMRIADLGTGSGAIALALASERPQARVVAVDASEDALAVAAANARRLGIANVAFVHGDWWMPLAGDTFDVVASNPPYIAVDDPHLAQGDLRFEPAMALSSGIDGLDALRTIVAGAPARLARGGWLLLEHGCDQGAQVRSLLEDAGFVQVTTAQDLEGRDRVTMGRRP